jgi:hypothetical protein
MTDPRRDHAHYDELAAGYALHALDPDDELQFLGHAGQCPRCQQSLADYAEVAAALADTAPAAEPSPQLGDRIMAAAIGDRTRGRGDSPVSPPAGADAEGHHAQGPPAADGRPAADEPPADVAALRRRWPARRLQLAAAAAAVLIAGGGIWGGLSARGTSPQPPSAGCAQARQCYEVQLTAATRGPVAKVIISGGSVWLMPSGLPADDTARQVYVLWQITGAHVPLAVGSFDVRRHAGTMIRIGKLAVPYRGTLAFAVSLERGRTIPAAPSHLVALGQVSA